MQSPFSGSRAPERIVSGNKIIFANTITVHGNLNVAPPEKDLPLELVSFSSNGGILDFTFRNKNSLSSVLTKLDILVDEIQLTPETMNYRLLPVTCQYNVLLSLENSSYSVALSQEVPSAGSDRFQVVLALGRTQQSEHLEGPWGYSLIFPPFMPGTETRGQTLVARAVIKCRLQFTYDDARVFEAPGMSLQLTPIGFGYKAKKTAGFSVEEKLALLSDEDVNVVESVVRLLAQIGEPAALPELKRLLVSDLGYLRTYYDSQIFAKTPNPGYYDLPNSNDRMAAFERTLKSAVQRLEDRMPKMT